MLSRSLSSSMLPKQICFTNVAVSEVTIITVTPIEMIENVKYVSMFKNLVSTDTRDFFQGISLSLVMALCFDVLKSG